MSARVRLVRIIEALDYPADWECFVDRNSGEVITITEDEAPYVESDEDDLADLPDWERTSIVDLRRALKSADLVPLPGRFDLDEWDIMRQFSDSRTEPERSELLDAIHGSGAFRRFRRTIHDLDLRDTWFGYRSEALKEIAREWLTEIGMSFVEE
jgi:hypothetical protein